MTIWQDPIINSKSARRNWKRKKRKRKKDSENWKKILPNQKIPLKTVTPNKLYGISGILVLQFRIIKKTPTRCRSLDPPRKGDT